MTLMAKVNQKKKRDYQRLSDFRYQLRCFLRASEDLCRAQGVTPLQYQLLLQIIGSPEREWATIGELAERLQAKHHGVVALVDRCEKLALVERQPGRSDRRQVEVHLLPKGMTLVETLAAQHQPELTLLVRAFPDVDKGGEGAA